MESVLWSPIWLTFRVARRTAYSVAGKNPLVRGVHAPGLVEEWQSVRGLERALRSRPSKTGGDAEGCALWKTSLGDMWVPPGAGERFVSQVAAEMLANVYQLDGREKVVLDCGANVGFFSRHAFLRGADTVIGFEPSPGNAACLRRNLQPESAEGRFVQIEEGVWDRDQVLSFSTRNTSNPGGHHVCEDGQGDTRIPVTSIDRAVESLGLKRVDYIKMDVEGAEVRGIQGAARVIREMHPRLCIAAEHTDDLFANALAVIDAVKKIDDRYNYMCTESRGYHSPTRGHVLTPYSLLFSPRRNVV